jgi:transcriptional regulator
MYVPESFRETDVGRLHEFVDRYGFSTVVSQASSMNVSHLPLVLERDQGEYGTLFGHMAKANEQWKDFDGQRSVLCIFHGPHAYVSPTWYEEKPAVPTWNYAVVHATGRARLLATKADLVQVLDRMTATFEPSLLDEGASFAMPAEYKARLLDQIVGFEIEIEQLVGKYKLSQNRSVADQRGVMQGLAEHGDDDGIRLLRFMQEALPPHRPGR